MKWSGAFKIQSLREFRHELEGHSGVYEFGYVRTGEWFPVYIGRAKCLWRRLRDYEKGRGHNEDLNAVLIGKDSKLYVHYIRTENFRKVEARMANRYGIYKGGYYRYNKILPSIPENGWREEFEDYNDFTQCAGYCRLICRRREN